MTKLDYIKKLCECPSEDCECPYYDWKYQRCNMLATTNHHPKNECEDYFIEDYYIKPLTEY